MSNKREKLSEAEIAKKLVSLNGWTFHAGKLHREFKFADFVHAFGFMSAAALCAEGMNHHPDWSNVYNKVVVDLNTHDAGGVTELDFKLAAKMDELASKL